eukprot:6833011-Ditylum_brightwellii.AAC.1
MLTLAAYDTLSIDSSLYAFEVVTQCRCTVVLAVLREKCVFGAKTVISMQYAPVAQKLYCTVIVHCVDGSVPTSHD